MGRLGHSPQIPRPLDLDCINDSVRLRTRLLSTTASKHIVLGAIDAGHIPRYLWT